MEFRDIQTPQEKTMLQLKPNDVLTFPYGDDNGCTLEIISIAKFPITYKIQTTSPEKFRVRPRCGVLVPGEQVTINVMLKTGYKLEEGNKDKFLVMGVAFPEGQDDDVQSLQELWKCMQMTNRSDIENHRLCCQYKTPAPAAFKNKKDDNDELIIQSIQAINEKITKIADDFQLQMRITHKFLYLILLLVCILGIGMGFLIKLELFGNPLNPDGAQQRNSAEGSCPLKMMQQ